MLDLAPDVLAVMVLLCLALLLADSLRIWAIGRALRLDLSLRTAIDTTVTELFFSSVTPAAALGPPAGMLVLRRRGLPWDATLLLAFGKGSTSVVFIVAAAVLALVAGLGPTLPGTVETRFLGTALAVVATFSAVPIAMVTRPHWVTDRAHRFIAWTKPYADDHRGRVRSAVARAAVGSANALSGATQRLAHLVRSGPLGLTLVLASQVLYFAVYVGVGVVAAAWMGVHDLPRVAALFLVFVGVTYILPTPGGAGISEAMAVLFFGSVTTADRAVAMTLLFRATSFYLPLMATMVYGVVLAPLGRRPRGRRRATDRASRLPLERDPDLSPPT